MNLNQGDFQSKSIYTTNGTIGALYSGGSAREGGECYILRKEKIMDDQNKIDDGEYAVRRLLPCECAALQGFPKDYCDDVPHSDSAEYKLWGNGIALPSILGIMQNAVRVMEGKL